MRAARTGRLPLLCWAAVLLIAAGPAAAAGHRGARQKLPPPADLLAQIGFEPPLGATVPSGLVFRDADGKRRRLGAALAGRPTLLVPGYYRCANLCDVVRAGVAQAVAASGFTPGEQFNLVLFSIDPHESPTDAAAAQRTDAEVNPRAQVQRWSYLTGNRAAVTALARAIGFRFFLDPRNGQYAHASGIVLLSPQGTITQYLPGVEFAPLTLRLALVNASRGRIGTLVDRLLLVCCDYDASTGRYGLLISRVLQGLGLLTLATLAGLLFFLWRTERRATPGGKPP